MWPQNVYYTAPMTVFGGRINVHRVLNWHTIHGLDQYWAAMEVDILNVPLAPNAEHRNNCVLLTFFGGFRGFSFIWDVGTLNLIRAIVLFY